MLTSKLKVVMVAFAVVLLPVLAEGQVDATEATSDEAETVEVEVGEWQVEPPTDAGSVLNERALHNCGGTAYNHALNACCFRYEGENKVYKIERREQTGCIDIHTCRSSNGC